MFKILENTGVANAVAVFKISMFGVCMFRLRTETGLLFKLFYDGGPYHIETSPLICTANQWTDFYMILTSVMKALKSSRNVD